MQGSSRKQPSSDWREFGGNNGSGRDDVGILDEQDACVDEDRMSDDAEIQCELMLGKERRWGDRVL